MAVSHLRRRHYYPHTGLCSTVADRRRRRGAVDRSGSPWVATLVTEVVQMSVALALLSAHLLADFPLQTDEMAAQKLDSVFMRVYHCSVHWMVTGLFLMVTMSDYQSIAIGVVLVTVAHFIIDTRRWAEPKDGFEAYPIAVDQSLHITSLFLVAVVIA